VQYIFAVSKYHSRTSAPLDGKVKGLTPIGHSALVNQFRALPL